MHIYLYKLIVLDSNLSPSPFWESRTWNFIPHTYDVVKMLWSYNKSIHLKKKKKKTQSNNISLHTLKLWESVVRVMVLIIFLIIDNNDIIANKNVYYIRIRIEWRKGRHRPHRGFSKTRSHRRSSQGACFTVNISQVFRGIPNSLLLKTKQISLSLSSLV